MAFGSTLKPKRAPEHVRPVTGALVRIVVLAMLAIGGSAWGMYAYYTHAFRVKSRPIPSATDSNVIEVELAPTSSAR